jgi:hypothetical protein
MVKKSMLAYCPISFLFYISPSDEDKTGTVLAPGCCAVEREESGVV